MFERDRFLIPETIAAFQNDVIANEQGDPLLFVFHPFHFRRRLVAVLAGFAAGFVALTPILVMIMLVRGPAMLIFLALGPAVFLLALYATAQSIIPTRRITLRSGARDGPLELEILQTKRVQLLTRRYVLKDAAGVTLGTMQKRVLPNRLFSSVSVLDARTGRGFRIKEHSLLLALIRRIPVPLISLATTNLEVVDAAGTTIGLLNRKKKLRKHFVLDLAPAAADVDRRLVLAAVIVVDMMEVR